MGARTSFPKLRGRHLVIGALFAGALTFVSLFRVGGEPIAEATPRSAAKPMDDSKFSDAPPRERIDLVFLHHSIGSQLLASPEEDRERGGGLSALLQKNNYAVHEATYGSRLGENTDLFDWLPKFRDQMADILAIDHQDKRLDDATRNRVVLFKSCYPNNEFVGPGEGPGSERGPELTVANGKATLRALLPEFAKHPNVLFVYLTTPPLAPKPWPDRVWKLGVKKLLGKPSNAEKLEMQATLARTFNDWVVSPDGWLAGYEQRNVAVFDLFGVLTDGGTLLRYPTGEGRDSHPSREGNAKAAAQLVPFLNRQVRRAGLSE